MKFHINISMSLFIGFILVGGGIALVQPVHSASDFCSLSSQYIKSNIADAPKNILMIRTAVDTWKRSNPYGMLAIAQSRGMEMYELKSDLSVQDDLLRTLASEWEKDYSDYIFKLESATHYSCSSPEYIVSLTEATKTFQTMVKNREINRNKLKNYVSLTLNPGLSNLYTTLYKSK
ncbi:hypothetical protein HGA88_04055 [Candidatus Roizmanbacteria bacterium]|nr:hypothetical protein [Candidatus Roizmanbacteria bacterium]